MTHETDISTDSAPDHGRDPRADLAALMRDTPMFAVLTDDERASIAARCEFRRIPGGELLCTQGSAGTELFVVVTGRLRATRRGEDDHPAGLLGEIGRGEVVGEMALMTDGVRTADVRAIRDTVVAILAKPAFDELTMRYPQIMKQIARVMLGRLSSVRGGGASAASAETLCLVPAGGGRADLARFAKSLQQGLKPHGSTVLIDGRTAAAIRGDIDEWLSAVEKTRQFIIYIADAEATDWTRRCLRQADLVLWVGDAAQSPDTGPVERLVAEMSGLRATQRLILVHPAHTRLPEGTRRWLDPRPAVASHLHVRDAAPRDFARLGRILARKPQGLVLGGGGARGFAHVGVFAELARAGFAVDTVGGTSIGAAFAALIAMDLTPDEIVETCKIFGEEKVDYTLPVIALSGGFGLAAASRKMFRDVMIEDLWLPFFSVTTNLSQAQMNVHRAGPLAKWVRASCSLPGALPPVFDGSELHADGCLLNNLPVDIMRETCRGPIVAVDIDQSADISTNLPYHEGISGFRILARKLWPFAPKGDHLPILPKLFHRALMIASAQNARPARAMADLYLSPPVEDCGVFDWRKGPRVMTDARAYAAPFISRWQWPGRTDAAAP